MSSHWQRPRTNRGEARLPCLANQPKAKEWRRKIRKKVALGKRTTKEHSQQKSRPKKFDPTVPRLLNCDTIDNDEQKKEEKQCESDERDWLMTSFAALTLESILSDEALPHTPFTPSTPFTHYSRSSTLTLMQDTGRHRHKKAKWLVTSGYNKKKALRKRTLFSESYSEWRRMAEVTSRDDRSLMVSSDVDE